MRSALAQAAPAHASTLNPAAGFLGQAAIPLDCRRHRGRRRERGIFTDDAHGNTGAAGGGDVPEAVEIGR